MTDRQRAVDYADLAVLHIRRGRSNDAGFYARMAATNALRVIRRAGSPAPGFTAAKVTKQDDEGERS